MIVVATAEALPRKVGVACCALLSTDQIQDETEKTA